MVLLDGSCLKSPSPGDVELDGSQGDAGEKYRFPVGQGELTAAMGGDTACDSCAVDILRISGSLSRTRFFA